ncbi:carboxylesterase NlhH-like [Ruditapes philippinarum]|uniref:carboxylesterase NlhH-like n=1 Tax=Ruditapes philippinarum TaxID=129788 RepID=UPI00295C0022|nr:carboxylesterase NlhH-like [Ruditapes philippinarum]
MGVLKSLIVVGILVAVIAYYVRPVFPETASNHGLKTFVGLSFKFMQAASSFGRFFGFSPVNITRTLLGVSAVFDKPSENVEVYTTTMDGVEVMIFKPVGKSDGLRPGILHYHGGGWVHLSPKLYAPFCKEVVEQTQSVLVSVKYRLAPENLYPAPLEDCITASKYFLRNAEKYGVDKNRIGVKGDSAGGNLAMAAALKLSKEQDLPSLKFMSLDYPALQFFDFNLPCYQKYEHGPGFLTKRLIIMYALLHAFGNLDYYDLLYENRHITDELRESKYAQYVSKDILPPFIQTDAKNESVISTQSANMRSKVPEEIINKITDSYFAPLMASDEDLKRLPPTYIFNAEFDVLRDDGFLLKSRLEKLGKTVKMSHLVTEEHGYLNFVTLDPTVRDEINRFAIFFNETLSIGTL